MADKCVMLNKNIFCPTICLSFYRVFQDLKEVTSIDFYFANLFNMILILEQLMVYVACGNRN